MRLRIAFAAVALCALALAVVLGIRFPKERNAPNAPDVANVPAESSISATAQTVRIQTDAPISTSAPITQQANASHPPTATKLGAPRTQTQAMSSITPKQTTTPEKSKPTPNAISQTLPKTIPPKYQGKLQLFVLAGQSNMSGRAAMPQPAPQPNPRIWVFGNDYKWRIATEPVDSAANQIDKISEDPGAGFGPSLAFANALAEQNPDIVIGLIPCARGGTWIDLWKKKEGKLSLYGSCLARARAASAMGSHAGMLFFQGEADASNPTSYPPGALTPHEWNNRFERFVGDWRSDLNMPELPVVFAQIGTHTMPEEFPNWTTVQVRQAQVQLPFTAMIKTDDLALMDYVHFTADSYALIGQRFAKEYSKLMNQTQ